jgi:hypothetical protein
VKIFFFDEKIFFHRKLHILEALFWQAYKCHASVGNFASSNLLKIAQVTQKRLYFNAVE